MDLSHDAVLTNEGARQGVSGNSSDQPSKPMLPRQVMIIPTLDDPGKVRANGFAISTPRPIRAWRVHQTGHIKRATTYSSIPRRQDQQATPKKKPLTVVHDDGASAMFIRCRPYRSGALAGVRLLR
nr:hypothetical protein CFP56_09181 [Quercus suber]